MSDKDLRAKKEPGSLEGDVPAHREASMFNLRTLVLGVAGLVGMIGFVLLVSAILFRFAVGTNRAGASESNNPPPPPPGPNLQVNPPQDLANLHATQTANLEGYGWVDQPNGIVRIPIERAMQIIAERGLPAAAGAQATPGPGSVDSSGGTAIETPGAPGAGGDVAAGLQVFTSLGCGGCHSEQAGAIAPSLHGLYGQPVQLEGGGTATADDAYLRESILHAQAQIVAGYQPIMPSFDGRITEEQLTALVAYIKSLGGTAP